MTAGGTSLLMAASCCLGLSLSGSMAAAQGKLALTAPAHEGSSDRAEMSREDAPAAEAARAGMFLPLTDAPRTDSARAFILALGGYDGASDSDVLEGRAEVTVYGPIALRVGVLHTGEPEQLRPTVGARVQALSQRDQGIDMAIGLFYKPEGFTEGEGEIEAVLALGRRFGRLGVIGDLAYGQDPEARERDGEARLAGLYTVASYVELGVDSRLRFDLGTDEDKLEEEGGAEYDLQAGPLVSVALGTVAVGAQAGVAVLGMQSTQVGLLALATVSGAM
jgi:hypothetical protein